MVERTINVRGVELTKGELEAALETLSIPVFHPGDIVSWHDSLYDVAEKFVVVAKDVAEALRERYDHLKGEGSNGVVHMIGLHDGESYSPSPRMLRKVKRGRQL